IDRLGKILTIRPNWPLAHGKLGSAYAAAGKRDLAVKHVQAVAQHDPDDAYGWMMLGWLAYLDGNGEEAVEAYRRADAVEPFNAKAHYHWGLALAQLNRLAEAVAHFQKALEADPNHAGAC